MLLSIFDCVCIILIHFVLCFHFQSVSIGSAPNPCQAWIWCSPMDQDWMPSVRSATFNLFLILSSLSNEYYSVQWRLPCHILPPFLFGERVRGSADDIDHWMAYLKAKDCQSIHPWWTKQKRNALSFSSHSSLPSFQELLSLCVQLSNAIYFCFSNMHYWIIMTYF